MEISVIYFIILGILAIATAIATVSSKNPVVSAMSLVAHFFMLFGIYLTLSAVFLAVMQIVVYAGAIMVLVIFVIMLLNMGNEEQLKESFTIRKVIASSIGAVLIFQLVLVYITTGTKQNSLAQGAQANGSPDNLGLELFTNYIFAFEAIALLLLVAVMGAMILARRKQGSLIKY